MTRKEHYIKENSEIFDFELIKEEMDKINKGFGDLNYTLNIITKKGKKGKII